MKVSYTKVPIAAISTLVIMLASGCKKLIQVDLPINQLLTTSVFADSSTVESAVNGVYSQLSSFNSAFLNGAVTLYPALSSDELYLTSENSIDEVEFAQNNISKTNSANYSFLWSNAYSLLYQVNSIIENLKLSASLNNQLKDRLTGECKFIRALIYFYLVNYFGPVPLTTISDYRVNSVLVRSDTAEVYDQIARDLTDARNVLTGEYPTSEKIRANKWSAAAVLARVYLFRKDWTHAVLQASAVIDSGSYALGPIDETFHPNNKEAILQFLPSIIQYNNTAEGYLFIPYNSQTKPDYQLTTSLISSFESQDARKSLWIGRDTIGATIYYYPFKYKIKTITAGEPKTEYNVVLRLAEQYLIKAEALAEQGNVSEAMFFLDAVRERAGLIPLSTTNPSIGKSDLIKAIYHENQTEFFTEWGHRWFDLKRTGTADAILGALKPGWRSADVLFPIPEQEILSNPRLTQNEGY